MTAPIRAIRAERAVDIVVCEGDDGLDEPVQPGARTSVPRSARSLTTNCAPSLMASLAPVEPAGRRNRNDGASSGSSATLSTGLAATNC
jgi:hypothetical protein